MRLLWHFVLLCMFCIHCYCQVTTLTLETMTEKEARSVARRRCSSNSTLYHRQYRDNYKIQTLQTSAFLTNVFYTTIHIGKNKQPFKVVIDSMGTLLWVPSKETGNGFGCGGRLHNKYDPDASETSVKQSNTFAFTKSNVVFRGQFYTDSVYVGDLHVENQGLGGLLYTDSKYYERAPFDGVFPGGFRKGNFDFMPPIGEMYAQSVIKASIFTFFVNTSQQNPLTGLVTIGDSEVGDKLQEKPRYYPVTTYKGQYYWHIKPDFMFVGEQKFWQHKREAPEVFFDTSAPNIYLPERLTYFVNTNMGAVKRYIGFPHYAYAWELECSTFLRGNTPSIRFTKDGHFFTIPARFLVSKFRYKSALVCISNVEASLHSDVITLGIPFFKAYFTIFDARNLRIGFVPNESMLYE